MCEEVTELLALTEKLADLETRLKNSENQIAELRNKGRVQFFDCFEEFIETFVKRCVNCAGM